VLVVLKRGVTFFTVSTAFLAAMLGLVYFIDLVSGGVIRRWIFGHFPQDSYVHIAGVVGLLLLLLLLCFAVCLVLAWGWAWMKAKTKTT